MKIELITGATIYEAGVNTIKKIDVSDFEHENLIVVPDAFSMQAEKLVFDCLNIKSAFNIKVVGVSKLASTILWNNNVKFQRVSALEEVCNIYQAVKDSESEFLYFKECGLEFCRKILEVIKQFKACKVSPEKIKSTGDELLDKKLHDLKLIYQRYENLLSDKLDLSKLLEVSAENAQKQRNLAKTNLYFANFDSFSTEIGDFICKLASCVNKIYIGYAKPISPANAFIYEDEILKKVTQISKQYGVNVDVENQTTALSGNRLQLVKNLFAFDVETGKSSYFLNVLAKNKDDEIEYVAKYIKHKIFHGAKFNDFAIAASDISYYTKIKDVFDKYKLTYYSDDAVNLSQTILGRFLLKLFEVAKGGFTKPTLQYLASSKLLCMESESDILHDIEYYNIEDEKEFVKRFAGFEKIVSSIKQLQLCKKTEQFVEVLQSVIELVTENYQNLMWQIDREKFYKCASENSQALALICQVLEKLMQLCQGKQFNIFDFENLFTLSLESVKVETIPTYIDAVFIGDTTASYFEDCKVLFVLGATSNTLPKTKADIGIIDDEDIAKLSKQFVLEPDIKQLNRRSRIKLFECLQHAEEKLIVCCPADDEKPAGFVLDLKKMFGENVLYTESIKMFNNISLDNDEKLENLLFYLGDDSNLLEAYATLKTEENLPKQYAGALKALIKDVPEDEKKVSLSQDVRGKFGRKIYSATQLETYFNCPFKRFVAYDLKVEEKKNIEPDAMKFGSFQHRLLQEFVSTNDLQKATKTDIENFLKQSMLEIAQEIYDKKVLSRKYFINYLRKSATLVLKNVVYEAQNSGFRPKYLEEKIFANFYDDKKLVGYVDRIDVAGKYYRILDYKTGAQASIKSGLYFGKKLQLFLYAKAVKEKLKLDCAGVYYFNCQNKYNKPQSETKLLIGITLKNNDVALLTDKRLKNELAASDIASLKKKKTAKEGEYAFSSQSVVDSFDKMFEYANNVATLATNEIESGYIEPKPLADTCEYCPYSAICKHNKSAGQRQTQDVRDRF